MNFPVTIELSTPIEFGSERIAELRIERNLTVGDLKGLADTMPVTEKTAVILPRLTATPPPVIDKMSIDDFKAASNVLADFL